MKMRKFWYSTVLVFAFAIVFAGTKLAAPMQNVEMQYQQPNGETITYYTTGDEHFRYMHDSQGYILVMNDEGYITYATNVDGKPVASSSPVSGRQSRSLAPVPKMRASEIDLEKNPELINTSRMPQEVSQQMTGTNNNAPFLRANVSTLSGNNTLSSVSFLNAFNKAPTTGSYNAVVLYITFKGESTSQFTSKQSTIQSTFNTQNNYYKTISGGKLSVNPLYASKNSKVYVYQDSNTRGYYQAKTTKNKAGYTTAGQSAQREYDLLQKAVSAANKNNVFSNKNLDLDKDGYIDNLTFVISGSADGWSDLLWPHQWNMVSAYAQGYGTTTDYEASTINDVKIGRFMFLMLNNLDSGVLTHETSHGFGAPDLYHYAASLQYYDVVGNWDLMCYQKTPPQYMLSYTRMKYYGLVGKSQIKEITSPGTYNVTAAANAPYGKSNPIMYVIPTSRSDNYNEYIIIEYRRKTGIDSKLPNQGLLVYRVVTDRYGNISAGYRDASKPDEVYIFNRAKGISSAALGNGKSIGSTTSTSKYNSGNIYLSTGENTGIKITAVSGNGSSQMKFKVEMKDAPKVSTGVSHVTSRGGSNGKITLKASGSTYQYSFDGGKTFSTSNTKSGLKAGSYWCVVKDMKKTYRTTWVSVKVCQPTVKVTGVSLKRYYNKIKVSWKKASDAAYYEVYVKLPGKKTYKKIATTTSTSYMHNKLSHNKKYTYKVRALNGAKKAASYSSTKSATVRVATPTMNVKRTSSTKAKISWSKVSGRTRYVVYYKTSARGKWRRLTSTTKTSYTKTNLKKGKTYYYKVRAYRTVGRKNYYGSYSATKGLKQ